MIERTLEENQAFYGKDAADWLARWDANDSVWSISMGGMGPSYEQCIQITVAEMVRYLVTRDAPREDVQDTEKWPTIRNSMKEVVFASGPVKDLGLSGAQWGAALNLACMLYVHGPVTVMLDERVKDRHIQVRKLFPSVEATA